MCECYKIGGPFIAEDPDCPVHGIEAQAEQREREQERDEMRRQLDELRAEVLALRAALGPNAGIHRPRSGPVE